MQPRTTRRRPLAAVLILLTLCLTLGALGTALAVPRHLLLPVIERLRDDQRQRVRRQRGATAHLSEREYEVLELLAAGRTTNEIASGLFVSPVTVRAHVGAIKHKLGTPTRAAAVLLLEET